jgi:hypothetical protein
MADEDERSIIENFNASILAQDVKLMPFTQLVTHISSQPVLQASTAFFRLLVSKTGGLTPNVEGEQANVRVFLAAYMVMLHPNHVFEQLGMSEQNLLTASHNMDASLVNVVRECLGGESGVAAGTWAACKHAVEVYLPIFRAWRVFDEGALYLRLTRALCALRAHRDLASPEERQEIDLQTARLRAKIVQINGQAALDAFDAE